LVEAVLLDVWPNKAAVVDFGIRSMEHYEALYYPLRHGDFTPAQVDAARGNGRKLTELVDAAPHNPHKGIVFYTDRDEPLPEPDHKGRDSKAALPSPGNPAKEQPHPWPSEIAKANRQKQQAGQEHGQDNSDGKANGQDGGNSL
jgi:hypothetical protein